MDGLIGFIIGFFLGGLAGMMLTALVVMGRDDYD